METNTLIVTSAGNVANEVEPLKQWLLKSGVGEMQLILLPSFKRVLVVTESREAAKTLVAMKGELEDMRFRYTLADTAGPMVNPSKEIGRLRVPPSRRQFLVSPPASPPPEFDFSKCEQPPLAPVQEYAKPELVRRVDSAGEELSKRTLLSSDAGTITIESAETVQEHVPDPMPHTTLPPKSIFDEE